MRHFPAGTTAFVIATCALMMFAAGCDFQLLRDRQADDMNERAQDIHHRSDGRPPLYDDAELRGLWVEIDRLMQTGARSSLSCTTMPIGAKPCGGPWTHLVYSSESTNETRLRSLVSRFYDRQAYLNRRLGLIPGGEGPVATCDFELPPRVALVDGQCRVAQHNPR